MKKNHYIIIAILVIVCVIEGLAIKRLIYMQGPEGIKKLISLPMYSFSDINFTEFKTADERKAEVERKRQVDREYGNVNRDLEFGLVKAEGTWMSDAELANDFNTVVIECWKDFNHCFASQAELSPFGGGLFLGTDMYEITKWDYDEIKATSGTAFGCFEYELTMDRINQKVTSVRKKTGNDGMCEGTSDKPLMIYLSDQFKK